MEHGQGENNGSNGILMEEEIFDTPPVSSQLQQPQSGAQSQPAAPSQQPDELAAFNSAPSFDAMDGMDMGISGANGEGTFGKSNDTVSSGWQNQDSDMVFQGSAAGRVVGADQVVIHEQVSSNMILGLVGAVIGALIGAALWIGIYQLGYIAGIAGAAIIGFSIKGYAILGRRIDVKGVIFCAVLSIVTIYFAHRVSFAIVYMRSMNEALGTHMSFKTAYTNLNQFMKTMDMTSKAMGSQISVTMAYWRDLVIGYGLSAVIGIPMALKMIARS